MRKGIFRKGGGVSRVVRGGGWSGVVNARGAVFDMRQKTTLISVSKTKGKKKKGDNWGREKGGVEERAI